MQPSAPTPGIDTSHWQNVTDAAAVARSKRFAYVKVSDGLPDKPINLAHVALFRDAGMAVGGYHFTRDTDPDLQARLFIDRLRETDALDLPAAVDLEPASEFGFANTATGAAKAAEAGRYICSMLVANGIRPAVYSGEWFMGQMRPWEWGIPNLLIWTANYSRRPTTPHHVHQEKDTGRVDGIAGNVDLNTAYVDLGRTPEGDHMAWRVAQSLETLRFQLNTLYPNRSKASDGGIGDAAHASRDSDHNPWYVLGGMGIVTARDYTHDPAGGLDCQWLADRLVASRDRRIKYIIWNRRILSGAGGPSPWVWRNYTGANPHTKHLHLSVVASPACDSPTAWNLGGSGGTPQEDPFMALTDKQQGDLLNAAVSTHQAVFFGGGDNPLKRGLVYEVDDLRKQATNTETALTDVQAKVAALATGGVDLDALAAAVADRLSGQLATAVADELRKRMES